MFRVGALLESLAVERFGRELLPGTTGRPTVAVSVIGIGGGVDALALEIVLE